MDEIFGDIIVGCAVVTGAAVIVSQIVGYILDKKRKRGSR